MTTLALLLLLHASPTTDELVRERDVHVKARSTGWYGATIPLLATGPVAVVVGLFSGFSIFSPWQGPLPWGQASIAAGIVAFVAGLVGTTLVRSLNVEHDERIAELEAELNVREEAAEREAEAREQQLDPSVAEALHRLERRRPNKGSVIALFSTAGGIAIATGFIGGQQRGELALGIGVVGTFVSVALAGIATWRLLQVRAEDAVVDAEVEELRAAPPPPPPVASRLPPAPVLVGWSWAL
ncbi:MAG: hypothetical protein JNK82_28890 [Myxococcaceae bacterium]|nr:hypothetical protein [Myxococcaceae bacterium]